jgi:hypothetical protein
MLQRLTHRFVSLALLMGLVSAYVLQAWHNPALHHHDPCTHYAGQEHWHERELHCTLCDFVFVYDLPGEAPALIGQRSLIPGEVSFSYEGRVTGKPVLGYALRGPPPVAAFA